MTRLACALGLALAAVLCAAVDVTVKERATGKVFDAQIKGLTPGVMLTCTGVACRKKMAFGVKVYAIAQWIDAEGARKALGEWQGTSGKDLAKNQRFYDALASADIEKRLKLVFVRNLDAKQIRGAFEESLKIVYPQKLSPAAGQFLALFTVEVKEGQSIELRSLPGGVIEVEHNGKTIGRMPADPELAKAIWGIYFHHKLADDHLEEVKPQLVARFDAIW
jgi:hypothetical protein